MKKQTILNAILSLSLLGIGSFNVYKIDDNQKEIAKADIKINKLKKTADSKTKEIDKLKKEVDDKRKALDSKEKELEKTVETNVEETVQQGTPIQTETQQNNQTTQSVSATEYKVPNDQDNKKMAEQYAKEQEKQNEPVYANMNEDGNLVHFTIDNGISIDKFYELNPGVKIKAGQSYRVK
ncbi:MULTISPECIES: hypothetical protein [Vagococcus]|uniref:hypothetical protein n=1 Tax=Vagococcus TaxID=2737 RepID=UPI000E4730C3|nr:MULTISPECIES: hypothetical protein [Vagococcus]RHH66207.1 hypothetical protein DW196_11000 [Vagococcus sp. AM17-17]